MQQERQQVGSAKAGTAGKALAPISSAFHADVASGSTCTPLPLRAGPSTSQR